MGVYNEYLFLLSFCILHAYGDESCPGCPDISCSNFPCSINELCYLKKVSCVAEPCPGIPYCIMPNKICKDGTPVIDDTGGAVTCESNCEPLQECVNGFCCNSAASVSPSISDLDVVDIETDLNMGDGNFPPKFLFPDLYGNIDKEEKKTVCEPCKLSHCDSKMVSCPKYKDARCVQDNCSCVFYFVDSSGQIIDCLDSENPKVPSLMPPTNSPPSTLTSLSLKPTQTSKSPTLTLKSQTDPPKDDAWKYVLIAICGLAALCFIAFIAYKMAMKKRKQRMEDAASKQEEQKVPLNQVVSTSPDNNNDFKTKHIVNGNEDKATSSSTEKV